MGGNPEKHRQTTGVVLDQFSAGRWGFLRLEVTASGGGIAGEYIAVDRHGKTWSADSFTLDTRTHSVA